MDFLSKTIIESNLVRSESMPSNFEAVLAHQNQISSKNRLGVVQSISGDRSHFTPPCSPTREKQGGGG